MNIHVQQCSCCATWNYPGRAVCRHCLSDDLVEQDVAGTGNLIAIATMHHSLASHWRDRLPLRIGTVQLDCGAHVICFVEAAMTAPARVRLVATNAEPGPVTWMALPH